MTIRETDQIKPIEVLPETFYTLSNKNNVKATITSFGAGLVSLIVPDKNGCHTPIVPGFDSVAGYSNSGHAYYGCTIGRFANRIAYGKFLLNGKSYQLTVNDGFHTLHGGKGLHEVYWNVKQVDGSFIKLHCRSRDGDDGFPGNLDVIVTYTLTDENELKIEYEAATDADTVINLTNHAYFNLNGVGMGEITDHRLLINADHYTPVDETLIPLGEISPVAKTPFDFTKPHLIGERIDSDNNQLKIGNGYDHNFVLKYRQGENIKLAARAWSEKTGIVLEVYTSEPGLQLYTGNFMDGTNTFKGGSADLFRTAFAMETQHFPDSPNQPSFPSTILRKEEIFRSSTIYKLMTKNSGLSE